jgi:hypothetical protein
MKLWHLRHSWSLHSTPDGRTCRRCLRCGKIRSRVDQRAINEAKAPWIDHAGGGGFGTVG